MSYLKHYPILLLATTTMLSGCIFFKDIVDKPTELTDINTAVVFNKAWQKNVGKGLGKLYRLVKPAISEDRVYANDTAGKVSAFDRESGKLIWNIDLDMELSSGVGLGEQTVLLGSLNGDVVALNAGDGSTQWQVKLDNEILAPPQTNGEVVIVQANEGKLYGLNVQSGEQIWEYEAVLPPLTIRGTATPQVFGNNLIAGFANGKIAALSASDGTLFWERRVAFPQGVTELDRVVDVDGDPVIANQTIYATSYNGSLTAVAPDGRVRWTQPVSSQHTPLVFGNKVFVTEDEGAVRAFNAETGQPLWRSELLLYRQVTAPQGILGYVVVADLEGYLHAFDPESGEIVGRIRLDSDGVRSPMNSDGSNLYVLSNGGQLSAITMTFLPASDG